MEVLKIECTKKYIWSPLHMKLYYESKCIDNEEHYLRTKLRNFLVCALPDDSVLVCVCLRIAGV